MSKNIVPRKMYVLVKPDEKKSKQNEVGLLSPSNEEEEERATGVVISFDPQIKDMKKGYHVIYGVLAGEILRLNENGKEVEYKLLYDDDCIAFIR